LALARLRENGDQNLRDLIEIPSETNVRSLGAYYTPDSTASAIVRWAIRSGNENLLEPSAGGGALLRAAFAYANTISNERRCKATAFDIDPVAIRRLNELAIDGLAIKFADFLEEDPNEHGRFDLILANPPFNRNHSLSPALRRKLRSKFKTRGAVGIWVYFLIHSIAFLKKGGRLASIVPRSALFTMHGHEFLTNLCKSFGSVGLYELTTKPNWSSYAEEAGAVILADDYLNGSSDGYERGIVDDDGSISVPPAVESEAYRTILTHSRPLGDYAQLSIGAVTGRNSVFLLSEKERVDGEIDRKDLLPVVSRRKQIAGVTISTKDLETLAEAGQKTWLLCPKTLTDTVQKYLAVIPEEDQRSVVWFKKRSPWWKVQVAEEYHAVFTYMNDMGPRLVRLSPGIVCTNTLHRVQFLAGTSEEIKVASFFKPI
jgi:tRNA1(Val) A37 N6-methylase TrmN6